MYKRDEEIIKKLHENAAGRYERLSQGDVEYIAYSLRKLAFFEEQGESSLSTRINIK